MVTMAEISAAIDLIDVKKQDLHKSFLHLQSQSPSSFNLPLNWADLDSHFTTLHTSLNSKFNLLQNFHSPSDTPTVPAQPQLKSLCHNSDALALTRFIAHAPDKELILTELVEAYRCAPDAPAMVLDAVASFYGSGFKDAELDSFRSACLIMLDGLARLKPDVTIELKDKAMEMAARWNKLRVSNCGGFKTKEQEALGFLHLIEAFGLVGRFSTDDFIDCFFILGTKPCAIALCRRVVPPNNMNDVIQKFIDSGRHVKGVKYSIELGKTDEFAPVRLLEEMKLRSVMVIEETRRGVKDLRVRGKNATIEREIGALKSIIKCVNENHLQSEYPTDSLVELVSRLENEVENSKQTSVPDRPELKSFCKNSDGLGLNRSIALATSRPSMLDEVTDAYRFAPDAPGMVLDAMVVFYSSGCEEGIELCLFRNACLIMLEGLLRVNPNITVEVKDKAMEMAVQWNQKRVMCSNEQEALGFLLLVGAYGLIDRFSIDDIIDCVLIVVTDDDTIDLCRRIIPDNNTIDMIKKLVDRKMFSVAVKYSVGFKKTDVFPPVGLLEEWKLRSVRVLQEKRRSAKYDDVWNDVTRDGIKELEGIIKCIDENQLESGYPKDSLVELVNKLENELENGIHGKGLLRKQPLRAKAKTLKRSKRMKKSKKPKLNQSAAATTVQSVESRLDPVDDCHVSPPVPGSDAPSANDNAVELVTELGNEVENSKQPLVNEVQPTAEAAPIQSVELIQESDSQNLVLSPNYAGDCHGSPLGSGPTGSKAPSERLMGSTGADIDYTFYAPPLQPPSDFNSNGWISE